MSSGDPHENGDGRARRRAATRRRIVEATVELHTTIGPARTTIKGIAERAGVQRHTVYAHFPDERELFRACSSLWESRNPFPDPSGWAAIDDPVRRLEVALDGVYAYYERTADELIPVFEGAEGVPAMRESIAGRRAAMSAVAGMLARGRAAEGRSAEVLQGALLHALDLGTWRSLVREGGLTREEAVALTSALVDEAARVAPGAAVPG